MFMKKLCLIVDEMHPSIIPLVKGIGMEPVYRPDITKEEVKSIIGDYSGLLVRSKLTITKEILENASRLEFIGRAGAGVDNIDVDEAARRNIHLVNAPEGNMDALAEHAVAMLLTMLNRIHLSDREVRKKIWNREGNRGHELKKKTVAIIGYGYMGRAVAKRLKAFECDLIAYDKYLKNFSDEIVKEVSCEDVFEEADIISFHIPLTAETRNMVNYDYLRRFKKNVWLVNTARGEILVLKDLIRLLEEGKIQGAALDVLENEKLDKLTEEQKKNFEYLSDSDKVLLTPHVGGWTFESYERINEVLVEKIKNLGLV